jgi:CubicO group peptidase (beta-lactamase class C family)
MDDEGTTAMGTGGISTPGLTLLHETMAGHVRAGRVPGMALGVSRGDDIHIDAIGAAAVEGQEPIRPDALFRITSMTRPITAVATLLLVEEGRLALDETVDRLLPELADQKVLRQLNGPVDDTVAADRPITVRDLLTFRAGFGMILASPDQYPILQAEAALELRSVGPIRRSRLTDPTNGYAGWARCHSCTSQVSDGCTTPGRRSWAC